MTDDIHTAGATTPSTSLGGLSMKDFDQGIQMYLGIFKTAAQATGKGLKTAAAKAGEIKDATFSAAGRISNRVSAAVRPQGKQIEKPVTPRQELQIAQGPEALKPLQSMDPAQLKSVDDLLCKHNISHVNLAAHEAYAHQFVQATAVAKGPSQEAAMAR